MNVVALNCVTNGVENEKKTHCEVARLVLGKVRERWPGSIGEGMSQLKYLEVKSLKLDLDNYRTIHQNSEAKAINAMIQIRPDWFWALMESLLSDGYHGSDNILVLERSGMFEVQEGNRRVAALKLIYGLVELEVPEHLQRLVAQLSEDWKAENASVPCLVFEEKEHAAVKKMVALIHAKGQKAGRDQWTAVARARYDRDELSVGSLALDLLESYLLNGKNLSENQIEVWSGDFPITVLHEALPKLSVMLGTHSKEELVAQYPKKNKTILDKVLLEIGTESLGFKAIRDNSDENYFGLRYGYSKPGASAPSNPPPGGANNGNGAGGGGAQGGSNPGTPAGGGTGGKPAALPISDPKTVANLLSKFVPVGNGRDKVATLLKEMRLLKIDRHPHSFCFLLRSLFELSAKAFCDDNASAANCPSMTKNDGSDRHLVDVLRDIVAFMTKNNQDKGKAKLLHGAMAELGTPAGVLSVTSLNQLVHNPKFSVDANHICTVFGNVFPLLEELNR